MKKVELKINGLSYSMNQSGTYILVLTEKKTNINLPILIPYIYAQYINMAEEGIRTDKILIYDVVKKITQISNMRLKNVFISHVIEGVYYTTMNFQGEDSEHEIECELGDAICLSLVYNCPILCSKDILDTYGVILDEDGNISEVPKTKSLEKEYATPTSVESLESMLQKALENEEYEVASQIRDRINEIKNKN